MTIRRRSSPSNHDMGNRSSAHTVRAHDNSVERRIGERIEPQPNGCWLYNGITDRYVRLRMPGGHQQAHRFVYETIVGPVPDGYHLHHTCETPGCCNPKHLRPLTPVEHKAAHRK